MNQTVGKDLSWVSEEPFAWQGVEVLDAPIHIVIQSELIANEEQFGSSKDPRSATAMMPPIVGEETMTQGTTGLLIHHTQASQLSSGAAMDHYIEGGAETTITSESSADVARLTVTTLLKPGERIRLVKFIAYGWSSKRSRAALHDQVLAALSSAKLSGWDGLFAEQQAYLDKFWHVAPIEIDGDA